MLVGHGPAFFSAWGDLLAGQGALARLAILCVSQLFFLLKSFDVSWLRIGGDRRMLVAVVATVVLLHGDVFRRAAAQCPEVPPSWYMLTVGGSLAAFRLVAEERRQPLERLCPRRARRQLRVAIELILAGLAHAWLPPRYLLLFRAHSINRAPPSLS